MTTTPVTVTRTIEIAVPDHKADIPLETLLALAARGLFTVTEVTVTVTEPSLPAEYSLVALTKPRWAARLVAEAKAASGGRRHEKTS